MKKLILFIIIGSSLIFGQLDNPALKSKFEKEVLKEINAIKNDKEKGIKSNKQIIEEAKIKFTSIDKDLRVLCRIRLNDISSKNKIKALGCEIKHETHNDLYAWIPVDKVEDVAALEEVLSIGSKGVYVTNDEVTSAGVRLHRVDSVSSNYGLTGSGIKVGVISNGMNYWQDSKNNGDLPTFVYAVDNTNNTTNYPESEGTAMMEIIHDISPNAELWFGGINGSDTPLDFANRVTHLEQQGCKIIVDDIGWLSGYSYFQENEISVAIRQFIQNNNGCYISAAGNDNEKMYTGTNYTVASDSFLNFNGMTDELEFTSNDTGKVQIMLQWADNWYQPIEDYDLYVYDNNNQNVLTRENRSSNFPPEEYGSIHVATSGSTYKIKIRWYSYNTSLPNREIKVLITGGDINIPLASNDKQIFGHPITNEVIAVAATNVTDSLNVEDFSSHGPAIVYSSGSGTITSVQQPKITAADSVETFVGQNGNFGNPFSGTSAAAPHVAGIAALYFEMVPNDGYINFTQSITNNSVAMNDGGSSSSWSKISGFGRIDAYNAIQDRYNQNFVTLTINQKNSSDVNVDSAHIWQSNNWQAFKVPKPFVFVKNSIQYLRSKQSIIGGEKYHDWNSSLTDVTNHKAFTIPVQSGEFTAHLLPTNNVQISNALENSSVNDGKIGFQDPWLIDTSDFKGPKNRGTIASAKWYNNLTSPFSPSISSNYKGVFLNQNYTGNSYYSVQAPQTQTINGISSYFLNWSATGASFQDSNSASTAVVFTSDNAVVKAMYKGTNISNTANTFSNNSQKKVIQPYLGPMYKVYTSLNHVWLEKSNNGTSWSIIGGSPVDNSADGPEAKNPSIDYADLENLDGADIYITYQQKTSNGKYKIKLVKYKYDDNQNEFTKVFSYDVHTSLNDYATEEATPVIAAAQTYESSVQKNKIVMVWKEHSNGSLSGGLYYRGCKDLGSTVSWDYSTLQKVTGTSNSNSNPTMDVLKTSFGGNVPYFHLAYQYSNTKIKYCRLAYGISGLGWIGPEEEPSYGTGITLNYLPSITVVNYFDDQNYIYDSPKLTWVASFGSQDWFAELRDKTNSTYNQPWNTIHHYYDNGNVINKVNINKTVEDDLFAFVFSAANNDKYVKSSNLSSVQTLSTQVTDLQISNGQAGWSGMNIIAYNNSSLPYSFSKAATIFMKSNQTASSEGRAGCVMKGNSQFYFSIADIELDGKEIQFKDKNDTIRTETSVELNKYLETNSFLISDNSELTYVISYGISDSLEAYNELKRSSSSEKFINFRVELVDNNTDKVLGTFNEINQIKESIKNKRNQYYKAKLSSGSSQVRLRIVEEDNLNGEYAFAKVHRLNNKNIAKVNFNEITLSNNASVTEYALNQNYPNPFNPSTTINYQIPKEGFVTLKIYDVLGKEVTTLVNEFETKGRYNSNFNAENLASGVYIYQLKVNSSKGEDFSSTKKLLLMK